MITATALLLLTAIPMPWETTAIEAGVMPRSHVRGKTKATPDELAQCLTFNYVDRRMECFEEDDTDEWRRCNVLLANEGLQADVCGEL